MSEQMIKIIQLFKQRVKEGVENGRKFAASKGINL